MQSPCQEKDDLKMNLLNPEILNVINPQELLFRSLLVAICQSIRALKLQADVDSIQTYMLKPLARPSLISLRKHSVQIEKPTDMLLKFHSSAIRLGPPPQ